MVVRHLLTIFSMVLVASIGFTLVNRHSRNLVVPGKPTPPPAVEKLEEKPLTLNVSDTVENRLRAELLAQAINSQKCSNESWCEFIPSKPQVAPRQRFEIGKVAEYQNLTLAEAFRVIRYVPSSQLITQGDKFLVGECPRNMSAAWLKKMDQGNGLSESEERVYNFVKECDPVLDHEEMYLRYSLYFLSKDELDKSKESITRALKVVSQEGSRVYYWAGEILKDEQYFKKVIANYPFSWHAVVAASKMNQDLYSQINKNTKHQLHPQDHLLVDYVTLLLKYEKYSEVEKILRWNLFRPEINFNTWFYLNSLVSTNAPVHITQAVTTRLSSNHPGYLNSQVLALTFPALYLELFKEVSHSEYNFDPLLLMSLSKQESGFNPTAKSSAKAVGLMQLLPLTARHLANSKATPNLQDPLINIKLGTIYLGQLYTRYQSLEASLAAYNAGPSRVDAWVKTLPLSSPLLFMDLIPFKETRSYVGLIMRNHYFYLNMHPQENEDLGLIRSPQVQGVLENSIGRDN